MKEFMLVVNAGLLFTVIALIVVAALIAAAIMYVVFFYLRPYDTPKRKREDVKRVRTLFRAKGPAQTRIIKARTIADPDPQAHGDVPDITQAAYPRTARIRDLPKPMGV